ncbi:hypothetical protein [Desulfosporosinus sp. SB140]|uniref:hypothetical protein n=1 Tax=Desulfosporosinus paludis TaxID=3115649 RepID=UPI00388E6745
MKKKFLKITGILVLLIALGSLWGYNKYFKPDPEIQRQLNSQFGPEFFSLFDEQNNSSGPVTNKSGSDLAEKRDIPKIISMKEPDAQEESQTMASSTPANEPAAENQVTSDEINNKYIPRFNYLQNVALSRLDTLYSAAAQEYAQRKKDGTLNRSELAQKYIQAGTMLETSVDKQFYSTLDAMKAELIANNLPTDIISQEKANYEKAKSSKRAELLAKAHK